MSNENSPHPPVMVLHFDWVNSFYTSDLLQKHGLSQSLLMWNARFRISSCCERSQKNVLGNTLECRHGNIVHLGVKSEFKRFGCSYLPAGGQTERSRPVWWASMALFSWYCDINVSLWNFPVLTAIALLPRLLETLVSLVAICGESVLKILPSRFLAVCPRCQAAANDVDTRIN